MCPHTVVVSLLLAVSLRGLGDCGRMVQFQFPLHVSLIKAPSLIKKVRERVTNLPTIANKLREFATTLNFSHQRCVTVTVIFQTQHPSLDPSEI